MYKIFLFVVLIILCSCQELIPPNFGKASDYFPPKRILEKGIVNKFYVTTYQEKQDDATNVQYKEYLLQKDTLIIRNYNAGLEISSQRKYLFSDDIMRLVSGYSFDSRRNKSNITILSDNYLDWSDKQEHNLFHTKEENKYFSRELAITQDVVEDTTLLGLKTKKFSNDYKVIVTNDEDSTIYKGRDIRFMGFGKGEIHFRSISDKSLLIGELVEQIPMERFQKMKLHGHHRIAYIDPEKSLIKDESFKLCTNNDSEIFDYYNGSPDGHLIGRKGKKWSFIEKLYDPTLAEDESGYISVRFVINCEGQIGYFTTEEADLNYSKKQFSENLRMHLVKITSKMHDWEPTKIRGEARDSYAYIIYKLKNGQITEILP